MNQLGASSMPTIIKDLASEDRESYKNHLRISNHASCGLYSTHH
jgi:hypothetical protein